MSTTFFPEIKVDTTGIAEAGQNIINICNEGDRQATCLNFNVIKMGTMPILGKPRFLKAEDKAKAAELAKKMQANGWMTAENKRWCEEQGIVTQ